MLRRARATDRSLSGINGVFWLHSVGHPSKASRTRQMLVMASLRSFAFGEKGSSCHRAANVTPRKPNRGVNRESREFESFERGGGRNPGGYAQVYPHLVNPIAVAPSTMHCSFIQPRQRTIQGRARTPLVIKALTTPVEVRFTGSLCEVLTNGKLRFA